ncbi:hypothetical protein K438DRAFT_2029277 [Mycena galopus ATCC 62051]|nr:hypothetical protein K438DRAFT_2029277 [Mycena galopus ATCC 62051]
MHDPPLTANLVLTIPSGALPQTPASEWGKNMADFMAGRVTVPGAGNTGSERGCVDLAGEGLTSRDGPGDAGGRDIVPSVGLGVVSAIVPAASPEPTTPTPTSESSLPLNHAYPRSLRKTRPSRTHSARPSPRATRLPRSPLQRRQSIPASPLLLLSPRHHNSCSPPSRWIPVSPNPLPTCSLSSRRSVAARAPAPAHTSSSSVPRPDLGPLLLTPRGAIKPEHLHPAHHTASSASSSPPAPRPTSGLFSSHGDAGCGGGRRRARACVRVWERRGQ